MMATVAISDEVRRKLGYINNGNENLGDTVERLVDAEIERCKIKIPVS